MKIVNMQRLPGTGGNIKAIFDVDFDWLTIRNCKLIDNGRGQLWAAMPDYLVDQRGKKQWERPVGIKNLKIMDVITHAAREVFDAKKREGVNVEINSR